jgi:hypothetical protein
MMVFDNRYMPLLQRANLLAIINIVGRGMPVFNATTIMAMVDKWRSETQSFHLPCDEMMVTLEDVAMILGLPIRGWPATNHVESSTWRKRVATFLGRKPLPKVPNVKGQEVVVHVTWSCEEFRECPPGVDEATMTL